MSAPANPYPTARVGHFPAFRSRLRLGMLIDAAIGLFLLLAPEAAQAILDHPAQSAEIWTRLAGLLLIALAGAYAPAAIYPPAGRFLAVHAILARILMAIFFLLAGGGFLWLAAYEALFVVILARAFMNGFREDLDRRP